MPFRLKRSIHVASIAVLIGVAVSGHADPGGRKAERIIKKHIEALGGEKAIKQVSVRHARGKAQLKGVSVPLELWMQRPNKSRLDLNVRGFAVIQAYDGQTAWWVNPLLGAMGPSEMPAEFAENVIRWSDFDGPLVDHKRKRHRVEYVDEVELESGKAHKLEVKLSGGEVCHVYIDSRTYLEVKRTYPRTFQGRDAPVTTVFSRFEAVDGLVLPHEIRSVDTDGSPYVMIFDAIDFSAPADDSRFTMPARDASSSAPPKVKITFGGPDPVEMSDLAPLVERFNADRDHVRAVAVLSPT